MPSAKRDYYEVLGVERGVSDTDLKKAFRAEAVRCHPDRNPGDAAAEERFKELNEAYGVLSDPERRAAYDRFGHAAFGGPGGMAPGSAGFGAVAEVVDSFLGDLFGKRSRRADTAWAKAAWRAVSEKSVNGQQV